MDEFNVSIEIAVELRDAFINMLEKEETKISFLNNLNLGRRIINIHQRKSEINNYQVPEIICENTLNNNNEEAKTNNNIPLVENQSVDKAELTQCKSCPADFFNRNDVAENTATVTTDIDKDQSRFNAVIEKFVRTELDAEEDKENNINYANNCTKLPEVSHYIKMLIKNEPETKYWTKSFNRVKVIKICNDTEEFDMVRELFTERDNNTDYYIKKIERIENPFLMAGFVMKRQEYENQLPILPVSTRLLFHATDYYSTKAIINENFNWRLSGAARGHKYGYGTCFSPFSDFASQFGRSSRNECHMLLCYVIQRKTAKGNENMKIPKEGADTATSIDGKVIVKFDDDTAYPAYRITYEKREINHYQEQYYDQYPYFGYAHDSNRTYNYPPHQRSYYTYFGNSINFNNVVQQRNGQQNGKSRKANQKRKHRKNRHTPY